MTFFAINLAVPPPAAFWHRAQDASRKEEALAEALDALNDPHPLVRLAG